MPRTTLPGGGRTLLRQGTRDLLLTRVDRDRHGGHERGREALARRFDPDLT